MPSAGPVFEDLLELMPDLFAACLFLIVLVLEGAIVSYVVCDERQLKVLRKMKIEQNEIFLGTCYLIDRWWLAREVGP